MEELKRVLTGTGKPMTKEKFEELKKAIEESKKQTKRDSQIDSTVLNLKINS